MVQEVWVLSWAEGKLGDRLGVSVLAGWRGCRMIVQPSVLGWVDRSQDTRSETLSPRLGGQETGYHIRSPQSWAG
jgi:hypothetical protein